MIDKKNYKELPDYNPFFDRIKKSFLCFRRYTPNIILLLVAFGVFIGLRKLPEASVVIYAPAAAVLVITAFSVRIAFEWERVPLLRFGKFTKTKGPGLFFIIPFVDLPLDYVDTRIIVTDFSAENVLTRDAVPVYVDAIIFWMVWDAAKAKLEVENYRQAVPLSAKTALRDIIGKTSLSRLLADRNEIGHGLQKYLDAKTNPWGITSLAVEIKEIIIPKELEEAMSREAQAEREKNARLILGSAEIDLAQKYASASEAYKGNYEALTLRSLNSLMDALKNKGSMILVPSDVPNLMNKAIAAALAKNKASENLSPEAGERIKT